MASVLGMVAQNLQIRDVRNYELCLIMFVLSRMRFIGNQTYIEIGVKNKVKYMLLNFPLNNYE